MHRIHMFSLYHLFPDMIHFNVLILFGIMEFDGPELELYFPRHG